VFAAAVKMLSISLQENSVAAVAAGQGADESWRIVAAVAGSAMLATTRACRDEINNIDMQSWRPTQARARCPKRVGGSQVQRHIATLYSNVGALVKTTTIFCMRVVSLIVSLGLAQAAAAETDAGIGVSIQSDDSLIYVPIDFNKKFRLEPSVRFLEEDFDLGSGIKAEAESLELGLGLFGLGGIGEQLRFYYGGRLAYVRTEFDAFDPFFGGISTERQEGYRISPTLGFEYLINDRLSIGGEAEYFYQDLDADRSFAGGDRRRRSGTDTRLIVRFKF
jgi:hypothetical protein